MEAETAEVETEASGQVTDKVRPEAVGPRKAAAIVDVSESTIKRAIRAGKLPAIRVGRQWRIKISDLQRGWHN